MDQKARWVVLLGLLGALSARANERLFAYTYESAVLPPGGKELELWVTPRLGRESYYARFDNRAELELGISERVMTALYLNFTMRQSGEARQDSLSASVSNEWKWKLLDPAADPVGLALYGEVGAGLDELELEAKLIADKRWGPLTVALNLVGEQEWEFEGSEVHVERKLEQVAGVALAIAPRFSAGFEVRNHLVYGAHGFEGGAVFAGPVMSYGGQGFFATFALLPQLAGIHPAAHAAKGLELKEHERFNMRLLFGAHL